jgi:8-amino-7-oxononanoate synthase
VNRVARGGDIAIVGMACRFPGAENASRYWKLIVEGRHRFAPPPADRWDHASFWSTSQRSVDRYYCPNGAFLDDIRSFAAMEFGIPPRRVEVMDPQQRLALEAAWHALEDAGYAASIEGVEGGRPIARKRVGTFVGLSVMEFRTLLATRSTAQMMAAGLFGDTATEEEAAALGRMTNRLVPSRAFTGPGVLGSMSAAVVAQELDLGGPAYTMDAACASALVAVHDAVSHLRSGAVDAALAGGVYLNLTPEHLIGFSRIGAISASGICRPFDAQADGFVQGEGVGMVLLKRLEDARRDGDRVYAVLRGSACNNDGKGDGPMSPRGDGQEAVIADAWADAGIGPRDIGYVETHGTGTTVGDRTELGALKAQLAGRGSPVWIGSAKANVGHTMSAAGIAGLMKAVLAVHKKTIPPLANWSAPHPDIASAPEFFAVPTAPMPWASAGPRVATVSSFGFGGTNAHVVLQEAEAAPEPRLFRAAVPDSPHIGTAQLVVISADDGALLSAYAAELADTLEDDQPLPAVAHTLNVGRKRRAVRAAVVATSVADLRKHMRCVADTLATDPATTGALGRDVVVGNAAQPVPVAFLCPGQGMQKVGLLREWQALPEYAATLAAMEAAMADITARPLRDYLYADDADEAALTDTQIAQPAMFAVGSAVAAVLARFGVKPSVVLGHSLGEFTASALAGAVDPAEAIRFVARRGKAMAELQGDHGAMAACMCAAEEIEPHLEPQVILANRNHPRQNVISGPTEAVERSVERLMAAGQKARRIPVSHAFHSPMLESVQADVDRGLAETTFGPPSITMASCIAAEAPTTAEAVRKIYRKHAVAPVEYIRGLEQCRAAGARIYVQLAPGATLCAFARGVLGDGESVVSVAAEDGDGGIGLLRVLALCAANGHRVDLTGFGLGLAMVPPAPLATQVYWPVMAEKQRGGSIVAGKGDSAAPAAAPEAAAPAATAPHGDDDVHTRVLRIVSKVSAFPYESLRADQKLLDDLGFDSLMANELSTRLSEAFPGFAGIPRALFASSPSLSDLVRQVEGGGGGDALPLTAPERPVQAWRPALVPAPFSHHPAGGAVRVLEHPSLAELRGLPRGDLVVISEVLGSDPDRAGVTGFVKALAREWADHKVCVVQGTRAEAEVEARAAERDVEVVFQGGERFVVGLEPAALPAPRLAGATVLVTGGTGWLGGVIARRLVAAGAKVIVSGSRPNADVLAELGAAARFVRADLTGDLGDLAGLEVDGVVHAAGVLADGAVGTADGTKAWAVKVDALRRLRAAFPGAWITTIGSYAARFGNAWQTEYAAANEAMAALGRQLNAGTQVWGPWADSDMVATIPAPVKRAMREDGVWFTDTEQGARALVAGLGAEGEVVYGLDLPRVRRALEVVRTLTPDQNWLRDHALFGRPTVPMAMILEWACALSGRTVEDLTLYDGVVVEKPTTVRLRIDGDRFSVHAGNKLAWAAVLTDEKLPAMKVQDFGSAPLPMELDAFYRATFHGPTLRGIVRVIALGDRGVAGVVRRGLSQHWGEAPWALSPLAIDSALQLAAYWSINKLGRAGFPVRVARWTQVPTVASELIASLWFAEQVGDRFRGTVVLAEPDGRIVAVGEDVEAEMRSEGVQVPAEHTDFNLFPAWVDLKQRLDAALMLGIGNPYFKVLEGVARDKVVIRGEEMIHFSGYNYLGFSGHPYVTQRVCDAVARYGTSVSASRVASGDRPIHHELEKRIAKAIGVDDAVLFTAGHMTNVNVIGHLFGPKDLILHDELIHDSALQGMKLAGSTRRPFPHGDMAALEKNLEAHRGRFEKCLVTLEGVYSMDGDICDLPAAIVLKKRFKSFLMVDEAHSFGVVGKHGYGVAEHFGIDGREVDIWMGTLSKSLSSCGGYIAGSHTLVQLLKYTAPGFVYSAGLSPANTMASLAALELMEREPQHVAKLQANAKRFYELCRANGLDTGPAAGESAVIPVIVGNSFHALLLSDALMKRGINVQPILYPAVADNASRLRFFLSALHTEEELVYTARTVNEELERIRAENGV